MLATVASSTAGRRVPEWFRENYEKADQLILSPLEDGLLCRFRRVDKARDDMRDHLIAMVTMQGPELVITRSWSKER